MVQVQQNKTDTKRRFLVEKLEERIAPSAWHPPTNPDPHPCGGDGLSAGVKADANLLCVNLKVRIGLGLGGGCS